MFGEVGCSRAGSGGVAPTGHSQAREIVKLRMPQKKLDSTQVLGPSVDQCRLRSSHGVRTIR